MKIKLDFITNSSSTMYLVSFKDVDDIQNNSLKHFYDAFMSIIKSYNGHIVKTKEDLDKFEKDDFPGVYYDEYLKLINDGYSVTCLSVNYEGDHENFIEKLDNGDTIIVKYIG